MKGKRKKNMLKNIGGTELKFESWKVKPHTQNASQHHCHCFLKYISILKSGCSLKVPSMLKVGWSLIGFNSTNRQTDQASTLEKRVWHYLQKCSLPPEVASTSGKLPPSWPQCPGSWSTASWAPGGTALWRLARSRSTLHGGWGRRGEGQEQPGVWVLSCPAPAQSPWLALHNKDNECMVKPLNTSRTTERVPRRCARATHGISPSFCKLSFGFCGNSKLNWNRFESELPS